MIFLKMMIAWMDTRSEDQKHHKALENKDKTLSQKIAKSRI
jgi:hypothetical protein